MQQNAVAHGRLRVQWGVPASGRLITSPVELDTMGHLFSLRIDLRKITIIRKN